MRARLSLDPFAGRWRVFPAPSASRITRFSFLYRIRSNRHSSFHSSIPCCMTFAESHVLWGTFRRRNDVFTGSLLPVYQRRASSSTSFNFNSSSTLDSFNSITAAQLRQACAVLGVPLTSTDEEIKNAFRGFAKTHHPDLLHTPNSSSANSYTKDIHSNNNRNEYDAGEGRMIAGTEAYRLLRSCSFEQRRRILHGSRDLGAFYTPDEYAKAQRAYHGIPRSQRRKEKGNINKKGEESDQESFHPSRQYSSGDTAGRWRIAISNRHSAASRHSPSLWEAFQEDSKVSNPTKNINMMNNPMENIMNARRRAQSQSPLGVTFIKKRRFGSGFSLRFYARQMIQDLRTLYMRYPLKMNFWRGGRGSLFRGPSETERALADQALMRLLFQLSFVVFGFGVIWLGYRIVTGF